VVNALPKGAAVAVQILDCLPRLLSSKLWGKLPLAEFWDDGDVSWWGSPSAHQWIVSHTLLAQSVFAVLYGSLNFPNLHKVHRGPVDMELIGVFFFTVTRITRQVIVTGNWQ